MTVQEVLDRTTTFFSQKGIETSRLDAELLIAEALKFRRIDLYLKFDSPLNEQELEICRALVKRRSSGEPIAYIVGRKEFYGLNFLVNSSVLIPRPDSETLIESCLESTAGRAQLRILDLGAGSGCLGLALISKISDSTLVAVDKSAEACAVVNENSKHLGFENQVEVINSDVESLQSVLAPQSFDVVVANPPYIAENDTNIQKEVKLFEPALALFGGADGLQLYPTWLQIAFEALKPGGFCFFEIGATQGEEIKSLMIKTGFESVSVTNDLAGRQRVVTGQRASSKGDVGG